MIEPPDLELTLPASPENVGVVRHVLGGVAEALGLDHELLDDIRLAVSEACANVVIHAYAGQPSGLMDVDVHASGGDLQVSVRDHGAGMAPRTDSPGLGVGLPLMASLATSMELLSPPGGGTEVRMRFPLPGPVPPKAVAPPRGVVAGTAGPRGPGPRR
jgi:serine/threonine-protein kinase RsbW